MFGKRISGWALIGWGAAIAAIAVLAALGLAGSKGSLGRLAPALPSVRLSGAGVSLASLRGEPALVVFWASWCTPCEQEAPALERFWRSLQRRGDTAHAALIGVNWSDPSLANARAFLRRFGWTFPNLRDPADQSGEKYGVTGLPTTFAIDRQGRIKAALRGPQTEASLTRALSLASA